MKGKATTRPAVLGSAPDALAGTASGVNNAVARTAQLLAVAALPVAEQRRLRVEQVRRAHHRLRGCRAYREALRAKP